RNDKESKHYKRYSIVVTFHQQLINNDGLKGTLISVFIHQYPIIFFHLIHANPVIVEDVINLPTTQ
ncbi:MAG TPA: hypothetical protein VK369_06575, partial [Segetibacter sp.]|nr:hypothetical protein [Segetibacter sp.]